ncbi:tripartite tricarboxylate transporter permease [Acuticoccus kandeliae]|uniref:tripartite tricarboxylate transporter permease n=1 Tax=Acuticoccus kandeliae TaxID=2073160 RepID=UPI000D3E46BE|nr:tripartite tricarboxylate transporter permease [Acuticoccus kandeliae]
MDTLSNLAHGFSVALQPEALLFCFIGVTLGTLVGVLPGIGSLAAISMCLPLTFYMDPLIGLIVLAGVFYGAQYGSSTASILLNIPGSPASVVTCLDGYPMAQQGKAGQALFITTITSFVGGSIGIVLMILISPALSDFALSFRAPDYFALMLLGLVAASTLSIGSPMKGLAMVAFGLLLGSIGTDVNTGALRFTFGSTNLMDGIGLVPLSMGLFGVAELLSNLGRKSIGTNEKIGLRQMIPTRQQVRDSTWPTLRGSALGAAIGAMPGSGGTIASFMSYAVEKRVSRHPEKFGRGAVEGIAAPEASNNAAVQTAFIPTLCIGVPGDSVMAVLLGAMIVHGIVPGPTFIANQPDLFWGLIASFWIGNLLLLVLNIPVIGLWVRVTRIPMGVLTPSVLILMCLGAYAVNSNIFDVWVMLFFGIVGVGLTRYGYPAAPVLLGYILGPLVEENFRRAMLVARGDPMQFFTRPISATLLAITALLLILAFRGAIVARGRGRPPVGQAEVAE